MLIYPDIDPIAFRAFGFPVRWYGLMYLFALGLALAYGRRALAKKPMFADAGVINTTDFVTAAALGVILGGRLGYALFYKLGDYAADPLSVFYLWQGGMSFHGGLVGAVVAMALYARRVGAPFLRLTDLAVLLAPPGLGLGRIGNFIGGELHGRIASADLPWAMIYRHIDDMPRHPSQLYQAFLEGVVLAAIMLLLSRKWRPAGWLSAMFLICYGILRFISEFFREPDAHLGLQLFDLSRGQWLSVPMVAFGAAILILLPGGKKKAAKHKDNKGGKSNKGAGFIKGIRHLITLPGRVVVKRQKVGAHSNNADNAATMPTMTTITEPQVAEVAAAKQSVALSFALAAGGYVAGLPGRFWAYMNHNEPEAGRAAMTEEYPEEEDEGESDNESEKGALWNFFFDDNEPPEKAADYADDGESEYADNGDNDKDGDNGDNDDGGKKGGLWNFFFDEDEDGRHSQHSSSAADDEDEDDDEPRGQRRQQQSKRQQSDDADWDEMDAASGGDDDGDDDNGRQSKRGGGFFGFFFGDDEDEDDDERDNNRPSRRDKRRMKKKKRR